MPVGNLGFFTVDPATGKITYNFKGKVSAVGLDLLAGDVATPPADRKIRWHQTTFAGAALGEVFVTRAGGAGNLQSGEFNIRNPAGTLRSGIFVGQTDDGRSLPADALTAGMGGSVQALANTGGSPSASVVIIDGANRSRFLKILSLADSAIAFGRVNFTWDGTPNLIVPDFSHNLGVFPQMVLLTPVRFLVPATNFSINNFTSSIISVGADRNSGVPVAVGTADAFYWAAIS